MNASVDILIVTVNRTEAKAALTVLGKATSKPAEIYTFGNCAYTDLGSLNEHRVFMVQSEMGSTSLGASQQTVEEAITTLEPTAVFMVGVAFGMRPEKQRIGDVLVSKQILLYEPQRVSSGGGDLKLLPRGSRVDASTRLLSLLRAADTHAGEESMTVEFGLVLSGEKLVDNIPFRQQLSALEPEAIGGEMEGAGLYTACQRKKVDWILVKGICDWADGHKARNKARSQRIAARNAVSIVVKALQIGKLSVSQPGSHSIARLISGSRATLSKVIITLNGDFENFGDNERRALVTAVSRIIGIQETELHVLEVARGSVRVTLRMPSSAARLLKRLWRIENRELLGHGIIDIRMARGRPSALHHAETEPLSRGSKKDAARDEFGVAEGEAALAAAIEEVERYRKRARDNRSSSLSDLAGSLDGLATRQQETGQQLLALGSALEAVHLHRGLAGRHREAFLPALAGSLGRLSLKFRATGRYEEAAGAAQESVDLYRELSGHNPEVFVPVLAGSLNNLANRRSEAGQRADAVASALEAVKLSRALWASHKDETSLMDLAGSLHNLAIIQSRLGQRGAALASAAEAEAKYRELTRRSPRLYVPELAMAITTLATTLNGAGQHDAALATAREAAALCRELVVQNRAFLPGLASSLNGLANREDAVGQHDSALATSREAVTLYRELVSSDRDTFLSELAASLSNLSNRLGRAGQHETAVKMAREALVLYQQVAPRNLGAVREALVKVNWTLARVLRDARRFKEALEKYEHAIRLLLPEMAKYPQVYAQLGAALLRDFRSVAQVSDIHPDSALSEELLSALGPDPLMFDSDEIIAYFEETSSKRTADITYPAAPDETPHRE